jgi:hypothetical protein
MVRGGSVGRAAWTVVVGVAVVIWLGLAGASAFAEQAGVPQRFGSYGVEAGQLNVAYGIAVDQETGVDSQNGDVYVADRDNSRVDEFSGDGEFVRAWGWGVDASEPEARLQVCTTATGCLAGDGGSGAGEFGERAEGVAVWSSGGAFSTGGSAYVYVVDDSNARVERFSATGEFELMFGGGVNVTKDAIVTASEQERDICTRTEVEHGVECGPGIEGSGNAELERPKGNVIGIDQSSGQVYVGDAKRVQRFSAQGEYEATVLESVGEIAALAVAPNGDFYVQSRGQSGVHEYKPNGSEVGTPLDASGGPREAFAVDSAGNVFVDDEIEAVHRLLAYNASSVQISSFDRGSSSEDGSEGIAVGEAAEALYLINHHKEQENKIEIQVEDVRTVPLPAPGPAVVASSVDAEPEPHRAASVKAQVDPENLETEYFVEYGTGTQAPLGNSTAVSKLAPSFEESEVTVQLTGLAFSTEYHYCVIAVNVNNPAERTPCVLKGFVSLPATSIDGEWASGVSDTSFTLHAEVNPEDTATSCAFEYGTSTQHAATGEFEHVVGAAAIVNPGNFDVGLGVHVQGMTPGGSYAYRVSCEKEAVENRGAVESVITQAGTEASSLPDARVLERVATDVDGATLAPPSYAAPQAAESGGAIVYARYGESAAAAPANRAPEVNVEMARHDPAVGDWSSINMTTPYSVARPDQSTGEYRLFSGDLAAAVVNPFDEATPYRRTEAAGGLFGAPDYEPMFTAGNDPEGVVMGGEVNEILTERIEGADASLEHVVFQGPAAILPNTVEDSLYEWSNGTVVPVSVLPAGEGGADVPASLGASSRRQANTRHAVSEDGSLVYWSSGAGLYVRDMGSGESLRLDVALAGVKARVDEAQGADFQFASADGSRVFFSDPQRLTPGSSATNRAPDLYECVIVTAPHLSCRLSDLTEGVLHGGESANVRGLMLAGSEAGSRIYFVATGELAAGAVAGADNLYTAGEEGGVWHTSWIGALSSSDAEDWDEAANVKVVGLGEMTARASGDGEYLTFMSAASLTGYDNHDDVQAGVRDEEVYVYDAHDHKLGCVSCDPSGARPHGFLDETKAAVDVEGAWVGRWLGGMLAPWHNLTAGGEGLTVYQPRSVSVGGRVFFESATGLTAGAVNGVVDVYEFEPVGVGSCTAASVGFSGLTGGCVSLISPGTASGEAVFMDASADGDDVFFLSTAGSPVDSPVYTLYDAHSCEAGTSWACRSTSQPASSAGCETGSGCKEPAGGEAGSVPAPASSVFSGEGNAPAGSSQSTSAGKSGSKAGKGSAVGCRMRARRVKNQRKRKEALARCSVRAHDRSRVDDRGVGSRRRVGR